MQWVKKTVEVQREPCAAGLKPHPCDLGNIKSAVGGGEEVKAAPSIIGAHICGRKKEAVLYWLQAMCWTRGKNRGRNLRQCRH